MRLGEWRRHYELKEREIVGPGERGVK